MSTRYRLICPKCQKIINIDNYNWECPECHNAIVPEPGYVQIYRKGNYFGVMVPYGIFVDGLQRGVIGNRETMRVCLSYGQHVIRVGDSQDIIFTLSPENPAAYVRAYLKVGAIRASMLIETITQGEMPEGSEPHNIPSESLDPTPAFSQPTVPAQNFCFCSNCGTKLHVTDKFCFKCGTKTRVD